jgi:tripartite-type tricarboxylate transporter receptor subunit TctC
MNRFTHCALALLGAASMLITTNTQAQNYPSKVVRYIITDAAGAGTDVLGRIIAEGLTNLYGQQVIVENKPGAGGNLGADIAAHAPADGYTMLQIATTHAVNATLYKSLGYDLVRDFIPIAQIASGPSIMVVPATSPAKTVGEFVKYAKSKAGEITYASAGSGTCSFLAGELFRRQAGIDMTHIAYKGGPPAVTAVMSGEVSVYFAPLSAVMQQIGQGRLRSLGVTTPQRLSFLPEQPTVAENGAPGYQFSCWYGLMVPAKTPPAVVETIHASLLKVLATPAVQKKLTDLGYIAVGDKPEAFAAHIKAQIEAIRPIAKDLPQPQ